MQLKVQKLHNPVFSRKPQTIKLFKTNPEEICFNSISKMVKGRIQRDANLLMNISDSNSHI